MHFHFHTKTTDNTGLMMMMIIMNHDDSESAELVDFYKNYGTSATKRGTSAELVQIWPLVPHYH